jgi:alpha-galactosidase
MSGLAAVAAHARAGRVEPTRLFARVAPVADAPGPDDSLGITAVAPFAAGSQAVGPLEIELASDTRDAHATLELAVRNPGAAPLWLQSAGLGLRWTRHGTASLRFLRHGWQSWSFTGARDLDGSGEVRFPSGPWLRGLHHAVGAQPEDRDGWHESDGVTVVGRAPSGPACLVGGLERGRAFAVIYARPQGTAVDLEIELVVDAVLAPGEARPLESVRVALGEDASPLLEAHADAHGRLAAARTARPFVSGWCSWYHFFHGVGEDDVLRNVEALAAAREELPVELIQIDDGYQRAVGDWLETNERFPRGLGPLARDIRGAGFTPGIWTAPFCVVPESRVFQAHPDWVLQREGQPFRGLLHPQWARDASVHVLDTSRDDVTDHLETTAAELVDMGFRYLKLDFLYAAAMRAEARDAGLSRAGRLRRGLSAIRTGAGDETFLLGCGCPLGAAVGVVDGMRIGPDVAPHWDSGDAPRIPGLEPTLPSVRSALRSILARAWMHRRLWLNDPDCLMARGRDSRLTPAERHTLAAAIAASGGMTLFSDDVAALDRAGRDLVAGTLALAREVDHGLPGAVRVPDLLGGEIATEIQAPIPEGGILARLNAGDAPARLSVRAGDAALEPLLGSPAAGGEVALDAHESAVYRLTRPFSLAVFCDFDGTFSVQDVGATLAQRHAPERRPVQWARYERGEITPWEYNMEILDGLALPLETLEAFLHSVDLDPGAAELVHWCGARGVPFRILSDGFDYNLNRLQQIHGVRFAYDANSLRYDAGVWRIAAGHPNPPCGCGTGICKRGRIERFRSLHPGTTLVHIGNGRVSDLCGALAADVAFAKGSLAEEMSRRGEPFEPFETLRDVIPVLESLLPRGARQSA